MFSVYTVPDGMRASARLQSLKPAFLTELATAFQLYAECQTLFFDTVLTSKATWRTQLQRIKPLPSVEAIPLMRQLTGAMVNERRSLQHDYRRKAYRDQLTPAFFQQRRAASPTVYERVRVEELEIRWQVHGKFAHFGPKALLRTLHMALAIEERLQWAAEELARKVQTKVRFRRALPAALVRDYQQYLTHQLTTIQTEKRSLIASCYERLRIAVLTQTLEKNEVVSYTYARLGEQFGSSAAEAHPPSGLIASVFQHMQDCIFLHGDPETQRRTRQLPWFKVVTPPETNPPIVILQPPAYSVTYAMAAQFGLADQLPTTRVRRPQWLFKGTCIRAQFFSDNFDWASACLARGRAEWAYPQAIEPRQLGSLRHSLRSLDAHWTAVDTRLKNAQNALQHPIRRRFTQQTQQFLKRIESDYQRLRAHDTQQLGQYLDRLAHVLSSASPTIDIPYPSIDAFLTQLSTLSIGQTPVVQPRLVSLRRQVTDHRARQQQHAQTMARMNEATERLAPLQQQTRDQPADAAAVTALLDFVDALPSNDPIRAQMQRDITTWVEQAQNAWDAAAALQPEEGMGEDTDDAKRHSFLITGVAPAITHPPTDYHYLHNLGRLLPLIDNVPAREWLHTIAENLLCEYLRAWAASPSAYPDDPSSECASSERTPESLPLQGRPDPHSAAKRTSLESTPVEHNKHKPSPSAATPCELSSPEHTLAQLQAAVSLQAETLQCLGNPAVQHIITACESLRREGQWDALRQLATTQLHTVELRLRQRHRLRQLQQWEAGIQRALTDSPALALTAAQQNHLYHLAHRLADENNGDVETWEGFTATDRAWLGLGGRWFDRWTTTRSPLVNALSTLAQLYRVIRDLPQQSESQRTETMERLQHQCDRTLGALGVALSAESLSLTSRTVTPSPATRRDTPTTTTVTPVTTAALATTSTASTTSTPVTHSPYSH